MDATDLRKPPCAPPLSNDEVDRIASRIRASHLEAPALFLLEAHRPLAGLASAGLTFIEPLAKPFIGPNRWETIQRLTQDRAGLERLMNKLEGSN